MLFGAFGRYLWVNQQRPMGFGESADDNLLWEIPIGLLLVLNPCSLVMELPSIPVSFCQVDTKTKGIWEEETATEKTL